MEDGLQREVPQEETETDPAKTSELCIDCSWSNRMISNKVVTVSMYLLTLNAVLIKYKKLILKKWCISRFEEGV